MATDHLKHVVEEVEQLSTEDLEAAHKRIEEILSTRKSDAIWEKPEAIVMAQKLAEESREDDAIEKLKTRYEFVQAEEISTFLGSYPFLVADLNKIYEMKCRYFGETPVTLYYISETGSLDDATLAAYIETDLSIEETKEIFSKFYKECWQELSKEARHLITVDFE